MWLSNAIQRQSFSDTVSTWGRWCSQQERNGQKETGCDWATMTVLLESQWVIGASVDIPWSTFITSDLVRWRSQELSSGLVWVAYAWMSMWGWETRNFLVRREIKGLTHCPGSITSSRQNLHGWWLVPQLLVAPSGYLSLITPWPPFREWPAAAGMKSDQPSDGIIQGGFTFSTSEHCTWIL